MVYHIVSAGSFIISHTLLINLCRSWPSNSKVEVENSTLTSSLGQNSSLFAKSNQVEKHINYGNSLKTLHCGVPHGLLLGPFAFLNLNWLFFISLCGVPHDLVLGPLAFFWQQFDTSMIFLTLMVFCSLFCYYQVSGEQTCSLDFTRNFKFQGSGW